MSDSIKLVLLRILTNRNFAFLIISIVVLDQVIYSITYLFEELNFNST
jgi:hypothetical protein